MISELSMFSRDVVDGVHYTEVVDTVSDGAFRVLHRQGALRTYDPSLAMSEFERNVPRPGAFDKDAEERIVKNVVEVPQSTVKAVRKTEKDLRTRISAVLLNRGVALALACSNSTELLHAYMRDIEDEDATITDEISPYASSIVNIEAVHAMLHDSPLPAEIKSKILDHVIDQSLGDAHGDVKQLRREAVASRVHATHEDGMSNSIGYYKSRGNNGADKSSRST